MRVTVLFFGVLKDLIGASSDELELPREATLEEVFQHYANSRPKLLAYRSSIVMARNQEFSNGTDPVSDGDEIAFMPPVSGGSGRYTHEHCDPAGNFFALTRVAINTGSLRDRLLKGHDGAITVFEGVVRNNTKGRPTLRLEYECYEVMAVKMMARIGSQIAGGHEISRIAMVHRLGRLEIGEASVVIVVTAPHRKPAFAACLEGINQLKKLVPIWKKEFFSDGEVWVEGEWDDRVLHR